MDELKKLFEAEVNKNKDEQLCVVKLKTTYWHDRRGAYKKTSLSTMKRKSKGFDLLGEESSNIGSEDTMSRILNLDECSDGLYILVTCNEHRDWETGYIDDYDFRLVKYEESD